MNICELQLKNIWILLNKHGKHFRMILAGICCFFFNSKRFYFIFFTIFLRYFVSLSNYVWPFRLLLTSVGQLLWTPTQTVILPSPVSQGPLWMKINDSRYAAHLSPSVLRFQSTDTGICSPIAAAHWLMGVTHARTRALLRYSQVIIWPQTACPRSPQYSLSPAAHTVQQSHLSFTTPK